VGTFINVSYKISLQHLPNVCSSVFQTMILISCAFWVSFKDLRSPISLLLQSTCSLQELMTMLR
jgi:hypothetical protein